MGRVRGCVEGGIGLAFFWWGWRTLGEMGWEGKRSLAKAGESGAARGGTGDDYERLSMWGEQTTWW